MSSRHKAHVMGTQVAIRSRVYRSLTTKMEVVRRSENGETRQELSKAMGIPPSSIHDILKRAAEIKATARKAGAHKVLTSKVKSAAIVTAKHKAFSSGAKKKGKKTRVIHSLAAKMEVLRRSEKGETTREISQATKIPQSTINDIVKGAVKIKAAAETAAETAAAHRVLANKMNMTVILKDNCKDLFVGMQEKAKRSRAPHPLSTKLEIVRRCENGEKRCDVARAMGIAPSTIHDIVTKAGKIKAVAKKAVAQEAVASKVNSTTKGFKNIVMENMERLLKIWINEQLSQPGNLTDETIQRKALYLWRFVWDSLGPEETKGLVNNFTASAAWLKQLKEGTIFCSSPLGEAEPRPVPIPFTPKIEVEAQSPLQRTVGVAKGFSSLLRAKVEVGGYTPKQVINMDEMGLFWKKLPANTIISVNEANQGTRTSRDQFSLMLGTNATGDLKLKPLLVYHMESPFSLRGYIKEYLPVIWRSHPRGRVVSALCQNYVVDYISQRCKEYAMEHNLQNRFLLLVGNGPAYLPSMDDWADNIEVMFVPTMSRSVVQPMDHGISATFKLCYLHHLMEQLIRETDGEDKASHRKFWENYTIKKAVNNVKMAWDDITTTTLNAAWYSIWPECVQDSPSPASPGEPTEQDVVGLAHQAGFLQVTVGDITELLKSPSEELSSEELFQMELDQALQEHEEEPEMEVMKTLDINVLHYALGLLDEAMEVLEHNDPNCTRSCDARSFVERGIRGYRELYTVKKRKAQNMSIFCPHFK